MTFFLSSRISTVQITKSWLKFNRRQKNHCMNKSPVLYVMCRGPPNNFLSEIEQKGTMEKNLREFLE